MAGVRSMNAALVTKRDQWGKPAYHPANDVARALAEIAGTKTLTADTIRTAKRLGIETQVEQQTMGVL
jgi:hypothetical protein